MEGRKIHRTEDKPNNKNTWKYVGSLKNANLTES